MPKISVQLCDLCGDVLEAGSHRKPMHGIGLNLFHSEGGWGRKTDDLQFSGEVCERCYGEFKQLAEALKLWAKKRRDSRAPTIIVTDAGLSIQKV